MQVYELVRRSVLVEGKSLREASREFGVCWRTVKKMVEEPAPPGYRVTEARHRPRLGPFEDAIAQMLRQDASAPRKQRHTAHRIYERLRDEHGFTGSESNVRAYVRKVKHRSREAFVPLVSVPGEAEADFGEAWVEIAGNRVKAHVFVMVLPASGVWFAAGYPEETWESFADGHEGAFGLFGGVVRRCVYDNLALAVKRGSGPMKGRARQLTEDFGELRSAYLFEADFAAPRKGNEKGSVESKVGALRRSLFVPVPSFESWIAMNEALLAKAKSFLAARPGFEEERRCLLPLPDYSPSRTMSAQVDKLSLVRYDGVSYSVPTKFVQTTVLVRAKAFELEILAGSVVVARHVRSYERGRIVTRLDHYLDLLVRKPRAVKNALPVVQAGLPPEFEAFRRFVHDGTGEGDRRFVGILRLIGELGVDVLSEALRDAVARGVKDPADVRLLALREREELPKMPLSGWQPPDGVRAPTVHRNGLDEYAQLMAAGR